MHRANAAMRPHWLVVFEVGFEGWFCAAAFDAAHVPISIVHGWNDEICPAAEVVTFARQRRASLLMVPDSHRLADHVELIAEHFRLFLSAIEAEPELAALADVAE